MTIKCLKKLDKADGKAEIAELEVNKEDLDMEGAGEMKLEEQELDPI